MYTPNILKPSRDDFRLMPNVKLLRYFDYYDVEFIASQPQCETISNLSIYSAEFSALQLQCYNSEPLRAEFTASQCSVKTVDLNDCIHNFLHRNAVLESLYILASTYGIFCIVHVTLDILKTKQLRTKFSASSRSAKS